MTVSDIYSFLDNIAPFKTQESYDNSGFLIGDKNAQVKRVCVTLDITLDVIHEAAEKEANLLISHHPVIFKALKGIKAQTPVFTLIKNDINAICAHTNFDCAVMSDIMLGLLGFPGGGEVIEPINADGTGFGRIAELEAPVRAKELAERCKAAFKSPAIRYVDGGREIRRVGVTSGSGGSTLDSAIEKNCDAFITGEVKHSQFVQAKNVGLTLIEAGHFHTENPFCGFIKSKLNEKFPQIPVFIAESGGDFYEYM